MQPVYDFVIVGSGPSGGILARNLTLAGARCLLLEAGKYYTKETFPRNEADFSAQLFWGGGIEFNSTATMAFLRARCVGGTSVVNQALLDRFDADALDDWRIRSGIPGFNVQDTEPYYEKVESSLALHTFSPGEFNRNARLYVEACEKLGYKWKFLRRGQRDCRTQDGNDCIACLGGCHRDSKQSTLVTCIQPMEQKGLTVKPEFFVEKIERAGAEWKIYGTEKGEKTELLANKLILAAGAFGTTRILLNSGFKNSLPALGTRFSAHPQYMSFGLYDEPVDAHKGAFQTVASADPRFRKKGFKLEIVFAGPISVAMLLNCTGKDHHRLMKKYRYMSCIEVAIRDECTGKMEVDKKGKLVVHKELTARDKEKRDAGLDVVQEIMMAAGAKEVVRSTFHFGLHLMGGCPIGVDPSISVVDPDFQVHGEKNIYIADSSIFPSAPGINPSLTIMMLSQMLADKLIQSKT